MRVCVFVQCVTVNKIKHIGDSEVSFSQVEFVEKNPGENKFMVKTKKPQHIFIMKL